jgi:hypothetical protein
VMRNLRLREGGLTSDSASPATRQRDGDHLFSWSTIEAGL